MEWNWHTRACVLLENAEPKIGSRRGLEYPRSFQFHLLIAERFEKSKTFTKENRDDANVDFVNKPGSYALLSSTRATYHRDIFVTCGCFCLFNGTFDPVGDEGKRQLVVLSFGHLFWNSMSQDKDRHLIFVIRDIPFCHVVGTSTPHHRACRLYF